MKKTYTISISRSGVVLATISNFKDLLEGIKIAEETASQVFPGAEVNVNIKFTDKVYSPVKPDGSRKTVSNFHKALMKQRLRILPNESN